MSGERRSPPGPGLRGTIDLAPRAVRPQPGDVRGTRGWRTAPALVVALVLATSACGVEPADPHAAHTTPAPSVTDANASTLFGTRVEPRRVEPFVLTDQDGRRFRFPDDVADAAVTLLYLGYTHCPDICPDTMAEIAVALRAAGPAVAGRVAVVFVTVDPARDDPARLKRWIGLFGQDFTALTGSQSRIDRVQRMLGYQPGPVSDLGGGEYVVGHPVEYLAIAPDGTVRLAYPWEVTAPQLQEDLTRLVQEGWQG